VPKNTPIEARRISEIDWETWSPSAQATLLFVIRDGEILLIRKKRGIGAGKINGPGGKLDPGETPLAGAVRETEEELCVTPTGVIELGELRFQFTDGLSILGHVFVASGCEGQAVETPEAVPLWTPLDAIPYDEMWEDDKLWIPLVLDGTRFYGRYLFDEDVMLDYALDY